MKLFTALALTATTVLASHDISVPETVKANTDIQITTNFGKPSSPEHTFAYYRLFLTVSPPGSGLNPVCLLANQTAIETTSVTVRVPASVGPNGDNYTVSAVLFNTDPDGLSSSSGFVYSDEFTLVGGTGVFSAFETDPSGPWSLGDEYHIPCSAYDCVRACTQKYWPGDAGGADACDAKKAYICSAGCDGVTYEPWDPSWDDMDGDGKPDFECDVSTTSTGAAASTGAHTTTATTTTAVPTGTAATASTTTTGAAVPTESHGAAGLGGGVSRAVLAGGLMMALGGFAA